MPETARGGGTGAGRPDRGLTAQVLAAVTPATRETLQAIAAARGVRLADVVREAFALYIDQHRETTAEEKPVTTTVTLASNDDAQSLTTLLAIRGQTAGQDGATVTLTDEALSVLADLDDEHDGHYDGTHVWVGGTEYPVVDRDDAVGATYGPQAAAITALIERAMRTNLTEDQEDALFDADTASVELDQAEAAAEQAAVKAGRYQEYRAAIHDSEKAVSVVTGAVKGLVVRDLIGQDPLRADHYRTLSAAWVSVMGPVHPDDERDGLLA
jgi:hypothetical protein